MSCSIHCCSALTGSMLINCRQDKIEASINQLVESNAQVAAVMAACAK